MMFHPDALHVTEDLEKNFLTHLDLKDEAHQE